jgi:hypothetical protein
MKNIKIEITFDTDAGIKYTPVLSVTGVRTEEDLEVIKLLLLSIAKRNV